MRRSFFDADGRRDMVARIRRLRPDSPRRWGGLTAPRMVAHLTDHMRHCLGDVPCPPVPSFFRNALARRLAISRIPWPKGRLKGPPDAFLTPPGEWTADVDRLVDLVERFGARGPAGSWPEHAILGRMSGEEWGAFCWKHFDHHLRQFSQ